MNQVITNVKKMVQTQYQNHNISLVFELQENIGFTVGSRVKVEQVILNLLSNAKFAVDEQEFYRSDPNYQKAIFIKTSAEDNKIKLVVEDNGIGINNSHLNKIYDPFYTTKPEWVGTGLGLSIVYGIIKEMHGIIKAESTETKYTRFTILFPRFPENI